MVPAFAALAAMPKPPADAPTRFQCGWLAASLALARGERPTTAPSSDVPQWRAGGGHTPPPSARPSVGVSGTAGRTVKRGPGRPPGPNGERVRVWSARLSESELAEVRAAMGDDLSRADWLVEAARLWTAQC